VILLLGLTKDMDLASPVIHSKKDDAYLVISSSTELADSMIAFLRVNGLVIERVEIIAVNRLDFQHFSKCCTQGSIWTWTNLRQLATHYSVICRGHADGNKLPITRYGGVLYAFNVDPTD
jgi:hypothetical protein